RNARLHFFRNLRAYLLRNRFTVNNFCCHQREDSICIFTKGGWRYFVRSQPRCQSSFKILSFFGVAEAEKRA
ncbi:hypothetical protein ABTC40_20160, partial [Acinetobacter baumannii]